MSSETVDSGAVADSAGDNNSHGRDLNDIIQSVSAESFDKWYREREFRQNIEQGSPYFNGPGKQQPPTRHSPSRLLKCHRKTYYGHYNAPEETGDPTGIFWVGSQFEEDIALPYLREAVAGSNEYVTNSLWVDFTMNTDAGRLRIKGETDPVIVDAECDPLILTEVKTKDTIENTSEPNRHHRAQAHAYLKGLSETREENVTDAVIIYGSRKTLDLKAFHIEFDPWFWSEAVLEWAKTNTTFRVERELPPATPEQEWECDFCSYKERCGKGQSEFEDVDETGLLPQFEAYPREKLIEYLRSFDDAKLTPTLAHRYPDLADKFGVSDWHCPNCSSEFEWSGIDTSSPEPLCPACADQEVFIPLDVADQAEESDGDQGQDENRVAE